ncbi:MAG: acyltransferase [Methylotenera sp.]|jgi:acetyltransferase-like isoleucine patch superfamily enzyme|nr:acyltransferase [Methylotenera sp.]HPH09191.1 acyltransferase [Methylotenera sp.]HPM50348.1 acyltransferase [Methylotenera sp.]
MSTLIQRVVRYLALNKGWFPRLYLRVCQPRNDEYAIFVKRHGRFHAIGENCRINFGATITDPEYVSLGNNVTLSDCHLLGHDGVEEMLDIAYNLQLDTTGRISIGDNVFVGHDAIVLPNITIGANAVIAAGAVVTKDVAAGDIVAGVPAKVIGKTEQLAKNLEQKTQQLPWADIVQSREGAFDPAVEKTLIAKRVEYFFSALQSKLCYLAYEYGFSAGSFESAISYV